MTPETICAEILTGSPDAERELWDFIRRYRNLAFRYARESSEDLLHSTYINVLVAARAGRIRNPAALATFVGRTMKFTWYAWRDAGKYEDTLEDEQARMCPDQKHTPLEALLERERDRIVTMLLDSLPLRDREIVRRFYLRGEDREGIQSEMKLTDTQFRLFKSKAKARIAVRYQAQFGRAA